MLEPRFFERMTEADLGGSPTTRRTSSSCAASSVARRSPSPCRARGQGDRGADPRRRLVRAPTIAARTSTSPGSSPAGSRSTLDNAGLFSDLERAEEARAEIAETLQHGLLPPPLPHIPGWSVAASYRPAGAENEVGGDFYDAFPAAGGWMLVIGDVTGRGARAASVTAQARYTLRTAAALTGDPAGRALDPQPGPARPRRLRALQRRRAGDLRGPAEAGADRGRRPPAAAAGRRRSGRPRWPGPGRCSAPSPTPSGASTTAFVEPGQQLVVVTDGIAEASGPERALRRGAPARRARRRRRPGAGGAAARRGAAGLHRRRPRRRRRDPRHGAGLARVARAAAGSRSPPPRPRPGDGGIRRRRWMRRRQELVERLFDAFNRRDAAGDRRALRRGDGVLRGRPPRRSAAASPTSAPRACSDYLDDVATVWEELLITPMEVEQRGDSLLVRGRVYLRSRALGIRDMPAAWIWELRDGPLHPRPGLRRSGGGGSRRFSREASARAESRSPCIEIDDSTPVIFSSLSTWSFEQQMTSRP